MVKTTTAQPTRGEVSPDKKQTNWRMLINVCEALEADAKKKGFSSAPARLNHILTVFYFGTEEELISLFRSARERES